MRKMFSKNQIKEMIKELSVNATLLEGNFEDSDNILYSIITTNTSIDNDGRLYAIVVSNEPDLHRIWIDVANEDIYLDDSLQPIEIDGCSIKLKNIITNEILFEMEI